MIAIHFVRNVVFSAAFPSQHCLYFFPLPQGQGSLRPIFAVFMTTRPPAIPFCDVARRGVNQVGNRPPPRLRPRGAGGGAEALLYSLFQSAKLAGVEPRGYLGEACRLAIRSSGAVTLTRDLKQPALKG